MVPSKVVKNPGCSGPPGAQSRGEWALRRLSANTGFGLGHRHGACGIPHGHIWEIQTKWRNLRLLKMIKAPKVSVDSVVQRTG